MQPESESITEKAQDLASSAAQTAQQAASSATETAQQATASAAETARSAASSLGDAVPASPTERAPRMRETGGGPRQAPTPGRILYVGNLFFEVTAAQLEAEFARYGEITNSRVVTDSRGLSKGFAYLEFATQEAAEQAVREKDQKVFQGRRMAVQFHQRRDERRGGMGGRVQRRPNLPSKTLFIGNMSFQMSDRDLNGELE